MTDVTQEAINWMAKTLEKATTWEVVACDTNGVEIARTKAIVTSGGAVLKWHGSFNGLPAAARIFKILNTDGLELTSFTTVSQTGGTVVVSYVTQLGATCEDC